MPGSYRSIPRKRLVLPGDDGVLAGHPVQWWYWTGHLETIPGPGETERRYGFEVIFFVVRKGLFWGTLGHAALTDLHTSTFHSDQHLVPYRLPAETSGRFDLFADWKSPARQILTVLRNSLEHIHFPGFPTKVGPSVAPAAPVMTWAGGNGLSACGGAGRDHLAVYLNGYELEMVCSEEHPATQYYGGWAHPYDCGGYTYYYSRTRMNVAGTLKAPGSSVASPIKGEAWFDRQFGKLDPMLKNGYQWMALIFDDGRELMAASLGGAAHAHDGYAALHEADGRVFTLAPKDFEVQVLDWWKSPKTGVRYPCKWRVRVPAFGLDCVVVPLMQEQELVPPNTWWAKLLENPYWEGQCEVQDPAGLPLGRAYVEVNNFA